MQITSFYVPPYALNSDEFPVHITFSAPNPLELKIEYDSKLKIKEIYNIPENGITYKSEHEILIHDYEAPGYVGLIFTSNIGDIPSSKCSVTLESNDGRERHREDKTIEIFRPMLKVESTPRSINVNYDPIRKVYHIDNRITIRNLGLGSAVVNIKVKGNGEANISMPENLNEFLDGFSDDLLQQLTVLKSNFKDESDAIDMFSKYIGQPEMIIEDAKNDNVKQNFDTFIAALERNEKLANEFAEAIVSSYLKNIRLLAEVSGFLQYLNSITEGSVVLTNAVEVLGSEQSIFSTGFDIGITDLALNGYPDIHIKDIKFEFIGTDTVPLYLLFDWVATHDVQGRKEV